MSFQIEWVNHASYIVRAGEFELLTDPWTSGSAFLDGWDLVSPTSQNPAELRRIRSIWISHEHPDHFNPQFFLDYPDEIRNQVTVYFQETRDKRLLRFMQKQGFRTAELPDGTPVDLGGAQLICWKNGIEDSWSVLRLAGHTIVNLNDCIFPDGRVLGRIKSENPEIDVLLTQFGYAEKIGNAEDITLRSAESRRWRHLLVEQTRILDPAFIIPFASFKFFSHEENFYMNAGASTAADVFEDLLAAGLADRDVTLYPGEKWDFPQNHDTRGSVEKYRRDWRKIEIRHRSRKKFEADALKREALDFLSRHRKNANPFLYYLLSVSPLKFGLPEIAIHITDLGRNFFLNAHEGLTDAGAKLPDVSVSSENLMNLFLYPYGANTLFVNGRFHSYSLKGIRTLFVWGHLGLMLGSNERFDLGYVARNARRIAISYFNRHANEMPGV